MSEQESATAQLATLQRQIAEAERRLQLTLDAAGATGAWEWDIPAATLYGDARFAIITRQDPVALTDGVPTSWFFANIHPDDRKRVKLSVAGILEGAEVFSKDFRLLQGDGSTRWVHGRGRAVLDEADRPIRFVGELVDVTEQKRIQEQLRVAETAGGIGTFEHVQGFGTVSVSEQFCRLLGLHPTRVLPVTTVNGLVHPDDRPIIERILADHPAHDGNIEFRISRADTGEPRWLARRGEYVGDLSGPGLRYIGVAYDVTAAKLTEEKLRKANEGLSERIRERTRERNRVWQNSRDLLVVMSADGRINDINPAWSVILGLEADDVAGRSLADMVAEEDRPGTLAAITASSIEGRASFESRLFHRDGSPRWISWMTSREGEAIYAYGRHISVEKQQAEALREAEMQLRQSQKMEAVGQLTGGIAHDFNNMLTGVMGSLDIIKRRIATGRLNDLDRFMDAAVMSAQRAAALTHRLLAFSRRQSLDRRPIDVGQLIIGMRELLERTLGEQVRLVVTTDSTAGLATADSNQLENALLNLAINARDAMPEGGELRIGARAAVLSPGEVPGLDLTAPAAFVAVSVTDTGVGMAPDVLEKAFEPFFTTKPIGQGTGLGLSMVYGFARQSEGSITIESVVGRGTTVTLYLPASDDKWARTVDDSQGEPPQGAGQRVMVVEDDAAVRLLISEVLQDLGYLPVVAVDANAALDLLRSGRDFDLMVSDVGLPGMNGRQLAEVARQMVPGLKVLFVTGYAASAANRNDFLGEGMAMISKPFDLEQLASKISEMLNAPA